MTELIVRLVFSLAVVLGLLILTAKVAGRRLRGRPGSGVAVLHRQALSRSAAVTVVSVGSRVLVLGTTDHQVRVLAELEPHELDDAARLTPVKALPTTRRRTAPAADAVLESTLVDDTASVRTPPATVVFDEVLERELAGVPRPGRHAAAGARAARPDRTSRTSRTTRATPSSSGPLTGSVLSPQTWRQALQAVSGRVS